MTEEGLHKALNSSVKDLQQRICKHCYLVDRLIGNNGNDAASETMFNFHPSNSREQVLKNAIRETIDTLEGTRKSFKSKTLEALRKKLTQVLIDLE